MIGGTPVTRSRHPSWEPLFYYLQSSTMTYGLKTVLVVLLSVQKIVKKLFAAEMSADNCRRGIILRRGFCPLSKFSDPEIIFFSKIRVKF